MISNTIRLNKAIYLTMFTQPFPDEEKKVLQNFTTTHLF
ncbi:hypothetical protein JCM19238_4472 [Vibrio ponticus]|nr:hypothetical protein JCM19238_4472 [Vibrio ponticus]